MASIYPVVSNAFKSSSSSPNSNLAPFYNTPIANCLTGLIPYECLGLNNFLNNVPPLVLRSTVNATPSFTTDKAFLC